VTSDSGPGRPTPEPEEPTAGQSAPTPPPAAPSSPAAPTQATAQPAAAQPPPAQPAAAQPAGGPAATPTPPAPPAPVQAPPAQAVNPPAAAAPEPEPEPPSDEPKVTQPPAAQPLGASVPSTPESTSDLLRSRLSQALEEQLSDQQELVSAIGNLRSQVMRLGQEIAELRVQPPREEPTDAQLNTVTVEMREAVRFLSERLDGVTRMLALRGEELADVRISLAAIDTQIHDQADTITELSTDVQRLPKEDGRTSALHDDLRTLHRQMVSMEEAIAAPRSSDNGDRLAAIDAAVSPLGAALADIRYVSAAQSEQIEQLRNRLEPIAVDVTAIGGDVAGLVEGTADGAALDARVNESVTAAMRGTERRLMAHIDEAVLALAETLLRRRSSGVANQMLEGAADPEVGTEAGLGADPEAELAAELRSDESADEGAEPVASHADEDLPEEQLDDHVEDDEAGSEPSAESDASPGPDDSAAAQDSGASEASPDSEASAAPDHQVELEGSAESEEGAQSDDEAGSPVEDAVAPDDQPAPAGHREDDTAEIEAVVVANDVADDEALDSGILEPAWLTTTAPDGSTYTPFGIDADADADGDAWTSDHLPTLEPIDDTVTPEDVPKRRRRWF
jgi:hypothetical protein